MNIKQTNAWPLRWDLLLRYRLIEIIAQWEGKLTTNNLCTTFGIGRQQASKDINNYINDIGPGNLVYNKYLKWYVPSDSFTPKVTKGLADEYLHLLHRNSDLHQTFSALGLQVANTEVLNVPVREIKPNVIRAVVKAARQQQRLDLNYMSMNQPDGEGRIIVPHTIIFTGLRWHVRAWCEKNKDYRDFVLSRIWDTPEFLGDSRHGIAGDSIWNTRVDIVITPDKRLSGVQQEVVAKDYGMNASKKLVLNTRGPLVHYALKQLQLDQLTVQKEPTAQQVIIANFEDIKQWLFN